MVTGLVNMFTCLDQVDSIPIVGKMTSRDVGGFEKKCCQLDTANGMLVRFQINYFEISRSQEKTLFSDDRWT